MKKIHRLMLLLAVFALLTAFFAMSAYGAEAVEINRYGKSTITEPNVEYVYERLESELTKTTPTSTISLDKNKQVTEDEMKKAYKLFLSDYPECFWANCDYGYMRSEGYVVSISPRYEYIGSTLTEARSDLEAAVEEIMRGLPGTSNYDKALYLHDALVNKVVYEEVGDHQTVYGALVAGKAVCAGYAAAYQLLLQRAGIDAWTVTGLSISPGEVPVPHAWNVVWIEDGVCVYTDATWNDGDPDLFHGYFNISKDEMAIDHETEDIFILPECNHDDKSYFDINDHTVDDSTTSAELAKLFAPSHNGERSAVLYYEGSDFEAYIKSNAGALYSRLSGEGGCSYGWKTIGKEIHLTFTGTFRDIKYLVKVNAPNTLSTVSSSTQNVEVGYSMSTMIFVAKNGYYFPENYSVASVNGVTVTRMSASRITVSGTPTADTTITLPEATAMQKESTPTVVYTPSTVGNGTLSGVETGMKYSTDGEVWTDITSNADIGLTGITSAEIYIMMTGNKETTLDSDIQTIAVPNPYIPDENTDSENTDNGEETTDLGTDSETTLDGVESVPQTEKNNSDERTNDDKKDSTGDLDNELGCALNVSSGIWLLALTVILCGAIVCKKKQ